MFVPRQGLSREKAAGAQEVGGDIARTAEPHWPKGHARPYDNIMVGVKAEGSKRKGGTFRATAFVFPRDRYTCWSPAVLEMEEHLPAHERGESIPCFALLACTAFALPIQLSLS